ncbi:hypothetical protein [Mycetocola saprophilus]|uniref:hypothetical protein n=1 Tax=Mycetocola saprophilus TaxID=76636 RepID=UPI003BF42A7D
MLQTANDRPEGLGRFDPLEVVCRLLASAIYVAAIAAIYKLAERIVSLHDFYTADFHNVFTWSAFYATAFTLLAGILLIPIPGGRTLVPSYALVFVVILSLTALTFFNSVDIPSGLVPGTTGWWGTTVYRSVFVIHALIASLGLARQFVRNKNARLALAISALATGPITMIALSLPLVWA